MTAPDPLARPAPAVAMQDVTCTFLPRNRNAVAYTAVRDVSMTIADGEFVSVVGPTGCGKSTLLNVIAGLLPPSSGRVRIFGDTLTDINRRAGYMFQSDALMPWRTAVQNVMAGLEVRGVAAPECRRHATEWLERVGLRGRGDAYPHQLSGGMRKRVALAQMLILDPGSC